MKKQSRQKPNFLRDAMVLIFAPVIAVVLSIFLKLNYLESTLIFLGVPAVYLSMQNKPQIKRSLIFAACFGLAGIYADYVAQKNLSWAGLTTAFPFRIAGLVPIEDAVWFFLITYLTVIYYEHFFDHTAHKLVGKRMKYLYLALIAASSFFCIIFLMNRPLFSISYFYLKFGIVLGVLPLLAFIFEFPKFLAVFLKSAPYFLALGLLNEFVGLHNGYWTYPGQQFIGWIHISSYRFPYEELLFWMAMFSSIIIAYFEFFDDNHLKLKPILSGKKRS